MMMMMSEAFLEGTRIVCIVRLRFVENMRFTDPIVFQHCSMSSRT